MFSLDGLRLPDGAQILAQDGEAVTVSVTVPDDPDGFFGRQCPSCQLTFRMNGEDYEGLPDDLRLWCVYCGHNDDHSNFVTQQQLDRATRAAEDLGHQLVDQMLGDAFGPAGVRRRSGGGLVSLEWSYHSTPHRILPLPGIDEERLIRVRSCAGCAVRYAVFGEHRFCPVCGSLPPLVIALDTLDAEATRLDVMADLPPVAAAALRERGGLMRLWVDTLENLVGVVEALAGAMFRAAITDADVRLKGKGNIFQRLEDAADLFVAAGYPDVRTVVPSDAWGRLLRFWAVRHVFVHADGVVDAKYLTKVPGSTARIGQRLTVTEADCRQAIADTTSLCHALAGLTATP